MAEKKVSRFRQLSATVGSDLTKRVEESYATKDDNGKYRSYIKNDIPLKKWTCDEGEHIIDIIPFITEENNINGLPADRFAHKIEVFVHFGIGMNENAYLCPSQTLGLPCPICEFRAQMKKQEDYDEKMYKELNAKRRVVYNLCVYDTTKTTQEDTMYWEASYHLAEAKIAAIAKNNRTGEFTPFADPDRGKTIEFARKGKGVLTDYVGFKFVDRQEPITDETLDKAVDFSKWIEIPTYEELEAVFYGNSTTSVKTEKPAPAPTERPSRRPSPMETDELPFGDKENTSGDPEPEVDQEAEKVEAPATRRRASSASAGSLEAAVNARKEAESAEAPAPRSTRLRRTRS